MLFKPLSLWSSVLQQKIINEEGSGWALLEEKDTALKAAAPANTLTPASSPGVPRADLTLGRLATNLGAPTTTRMMPRTQENAILTIIVWL